MKTAINPTRDEDFPEWYQQAVKEGDLAENSAVRGCMVIKPWGYGLWEKMQRDLDRRFKKAGCVNGYFPLFIPLSYLEKEAEHVEGFAKECAVVTHHRLAKDKKGKLAPSAPLEEPLVVRPTSEMIIGASYAKWVQSYRDLPIVINQWANVVRWEMRPRIFLRTAEFLWQEGHAAYETAEEAKSMAHRMHDLYADFCEERLALPVIKGCKSERERFPGAVDTLTIEAMMQDRKALQAGTSHFLGQNFAKGSNIKFRTRDEKDEYAWTISWGMTTRLIGAVVMTHGDDDGLILPPRLASSVAVILPVIHKEETRSSVMLYCEKLKSELESLSYFGEEVSVVLDDRDLRGGEKTWSWIKKGIPLRIEVGPRDIAEGKVCVKRRDRPHKEMTKLSIDELKKSLPTILDEMHDGLLKKATDHRNAHMVDIDSKEDLKRFFEEKGGGFALAHFAGDAKLEETIQKEMGITVRCVPFEYGQGEGTCPFTGQASSQRVIFAKSY